MSEESSDKFLQSFQKLTTPEILRKNLVLASLYLTAYEVLKSCIVDRIRDFFTHGYSDNGTAILSNEYNDVIKLHKNLFSASCLWLQQNGAITANDLAEIMAVRNHRNQIAHELADILMDIDREVNLDYLEKIRHLLRKIDRWWIKEVDIPTNPDFDGIEVNDEDIQSGRMILIDLILGTALESK